MSSFFILSTPKNEFLASSSNRRRENRHDRSPDQVGNQMEGLASLRYPPNPNPSRGRAGATSESGAVTHRDRLDTHRGPRVACEGNGAVPFTKGTGWNWYVDVVTRMYGQSSSVRWRARCGVVYRGSSGHLVAGSRQGSHSNPMPRQGDRNPCIIPPFFESGTQASSDLVDQEKKRNTRKGNKNMKT